MTFTPLVVLVGVIFIAVSVVMMLGKGAMLIAGYNTISDMEKTKYDKPRLSKFIGKLFLAVGVITVAHGFYQAKWFAVATAVVVLGLVVFTVIYANTGNRFKK